MNLKTNKAEQVFLRKIHRKVGKAINDYQLIEKGSKILVGLSGGKDSLALLDILSNRLKYSNNEFELFAIHVNITNIPYELDLNYLKDFCEKKAVRLIVREIEVINYEGKEKNICFACSWNRRKILFEEARKLGFKKIALGHHMDDAVETLLMNMAFQGAICSMSPKLEMFDGEIEVIRPLILLTNDELVKYSGYKGFKTEIKTCPHERDSKREEMKNIVQQMNKLNPHARNNLFASMSNIQGEYLPSKTKNKD